MKTENSRPAATLNPMNMRLIKWFVQAALAVVGVLGAHDLAAAPEGWLRVFGEYPWIAVVLTFGGGVGVTLAIQDIWRTRLPHRCVDRLADSVWTVRQFFSGNMQSGHVRAYYVPGPDGEEPPDPVCLTTRARVRFKRPWRPSLPFDAGEFWISTTFVTAGADGVESILPPSKVKAWLPSYGGRNDWHRDRRPTDKYMQYRLPDGDLSPRIHLGQAPAQEWKELCSFGAPAGDLNEHYRSRRLETIDLDAVSELLITYSDTGTDSFRDRPSAVFSRVSDLRTVPASEENPERDRMLYCQLAEDGGSAAIGMPPHALPPDPLGIKFGLTFRQAAGSAKDSVTDTLLFYYPGGFHRPYGLVTVDWR